MPLATRQQILANLPPQASGSSSSLNRVPVYFFLLRGTDGSTNHGNFDVEQSMDLVNAHFNGLFEFYVCSSAAIDDDQFVNMSLGSSSTDVADLHSYVNLQFPVAEKCVKFFVCNTVDVNGIHFGGYAYDRIGSGANAAVYCAVASPYSISHELGHYFGLPHTFTDPTTQYVHDLADPVNYPVLINGVSATCFDTGDGFCDTPADRNPQCVSDQSCQVNCSVLDPLGLSYGPDPTLLMGYYSSCGNRFSAEQSAVMKLLYKVHPAYSALKNIDPACALKTGRILRHCSPSGNSFPDPFKDLTVEIKQTNGSCTTVTNSSGRYPFNPCNWGNDKRSVLPDLNFSNPLNGVTTYDLVLISKHILGTEPFTDPYTMIAADVSRGGSITTFDIVEARKLILGIYANFPGNVSWRYIPNLCTGNQAFFNDFNDGNPFDAQFIDPFNGVLRSYTCALSQPIPNNCTWMDHVSVVPNDPLAQIENTWSFTGVKVGDVNCTAESGLTSDPDEVFFTSQNGTPISIAQGTSKKVQVIAESLQDVVAWQMGISFSADSLQITSIGAGNVAANFDLNNFHLINGSSSESGVSKLNALWFSMNGAPLEINNKVLFEFLVQANAAIPSLESFFRLNANAAPPVKFYNTAGEEVTANLKLTAVSAEGERGSRERSLVQEPISSLMVAPVPFHDEVDFVLTLQQGAWVLVNLYHADGRLASSKNVWLEKGPQEVRLAGLSSAPSGLYFYAVSSEGFTQRGTISKM